MTANLADDVLDLLGRQAAQRRPEPREVALDLALGGGYRAHFLRSASTGCNTASMPVAKPRQNRAICTTRRRPSGVNR